MLEKVKRRIEDTDITDELIQDLIDESEIEVLEDTNRDKLIPALETVVVGLTVIKINRLGTEGVASEGYSGVSTGYLNELPDNFLRTLNNKRQLKGWDDESET